MRRPVVLAVLFALFAAAQAPAAPGTTERSMHLTAARFGYDAQHHLALRLDFDRRPVRLEQVVVGIHVIDPVRALGGVRGRRFSGGLGIGERCARRWVAGRTYPLLVIFCSPPTPVDPAGARARARAAKGNCTWIRTRVFLRSRF